MGVIFPRFWPLDPVGPLRRGGIVHEKSWATLWMFPKIGVPQNGWFRMENPIKMDDLGVPQFSETSFMAYWVVVSGHPFFFFTRHFRKMNPFRRIFFKRLQTRPTSYGLCFMDYIGWQMCIKIDRYCISNR